MMKFHSVHGKSVTLTEGKLVATKSDASFCHGIVFSDQPLKVNQKVSFEVKTTDAWSGGIRIGVTSFDPGKLQSSDLPKYAIPSLSKREGFWVCPISEGIITSGCKVTLYVNNRGQLQFFVNSVYKGACLKGLPIGKTLWLCLDLYGNTKSAKFIKADDAPKEILARGPEAVQAYEEACISGTQPVYRTRLMLVGQERVGKTSLKRALTRQKHNKDEEQTVGIDLSNSCSFSYLHDKWQMAVQGEHEKEADTLEEQKQLGIMGGVVGLQEEYHKALAENIVKELNQPKFRKEASMKGRATSRDSAKSTRKPFDLESIKSTSSVHGAIAHIPEKLSHIPPEMFTDVPERVVQLVQEMLDQNREPTTSKNQPKLSKTSSFKQSSSSKPPIPEPTLDSSSEVDKTNIEKKVVLNIWDFSGHSLYYTTHQVFLSSRAVYMIVFNLCHDLKTTRSENSSTEAWNTIEYMDYWLRTIYSHTSQNSTNTITSSRISPPILVVGTHRNSLSSDEVEQKKLVEEKFDELRTFMMDKPYTRHLITPFIAIENDMEEGEDPQIGEVRKMIKEAASEEPYMGEQMPIRWLKFEQEIAKLVAEDTTHASYDQIQELASNLGITDENEIKIMVNFYHDLGVLIHYGSSGTIDNVLRNTVVLQPHWLVDMFRSIVLAKPRSDKWSFSKDKWKTFEQKGILDDSLVDDIWKKATMQKTVLLGLMEKFDLLCPAYTQANQRPKYYFVPSRLTNENDSDKRLYANNPSNAVFYINFAGFLPVGLFYRIVTRTTKWCIDNTGKEPYSLLKTLARFYLDEEHDFVLEMAPQKYHRIKIVVTRVNDMSETNNTDNTNLSPKPSACAKLRNFLESSLLELKEGWMKRLVYYTCVECPCGRPCYLHGDDICKEEECLHFLDLDECLANRIVCCEHRRVKTTSIKQWFPETLSPVFQGHILPAIDLEESYGNIEKHSPLLPVWVKGAAKLLNSGEENQDWLALAKLMGYKEPQIEKFLEDLNPGLALLTDWIISSGNTSLSVDMLITFLEKMNRDDVLEIIEKANDTDKDPPQLFISYQWDSQDEVKALRDKMERSGFSCWMDIGQMGGGDFLSAKIDQGIRNCKVVLACITPKYVVSHHCNRELSLADLLNKTIIPIMFEEVPWPPPGGMSLIFSQLVYINMKGVGGHGGTGIHADLKDKYKEIVQKLMNYVVPDLTKYFDTETLVSKQFSNDNSSIYSETHSLPIVTESTVNYQGIHEARQHNVIRQDEDFLPPPPHYQAREQVPVTQSCVCIIL
ncbi:uncharacterized protein LOC133200170 isoform X2 [Saccostrea echinata]|uniref:uncharacterized protein LOC133200170 isoform X2 n=1 Tax=Saccostrea echinata TaxID=191078 RepID=UPI002A825C7F|nr:uncharacterized protein LOC133200170 isoform X2 [Saccostrea echinata]